MKKNIFASRRFKHGSLATIITIGFIVGIILINVVATLLLERFPLNIDLTADNRFALTQESIDFVKGIDTDVTVTVCADEAALEQSPDTKQALEILKNYAKYSSKISVDFVNLTKEPNFAKKHPNETFANGDIFVESSLRTKKTSLNSVIEQMQNQQTGEVKVSSKAEQIMTAALMYATDTNPVTVSMLTGLDNVDASGYKDLLLANNYNVIEQNVLTDEIDPEAAFVILPQPAADLSAATVKKLEDFLDNDGKFDKSLVFIASPTAAVGPVLKTFLAQWGMEVGPETVMETNQEHAIDNYYTTINQVADEDFGKLLKSQQLPIVTAYAKPINVLFESSENRKTRILTKTYDSTIILPVEPAEDFDVSKQEQKSFNTMVMGTKSKYEGTTLQASNVIVVSSAVMLNTDWLTTPSIANGDATLSMTSLISPKKDTVKILPVEIKQDKITITQGQIMTNLIVFVVVIPLLVLICGIVVWIRRRHL